MDALGIDKEPLEGVESVLLLLLDKVTVPVREIILPEGYDFEGVLSWIVRLRKALEKMPSSYRQERNEEQTKEKSIL